MIKTDIFVVELWKANYFNKYTYIKSSFNGYNEFQLHFTC